MAPASMLSHCAVEAVSPPGSTSACRYMIMPVWVQMSKCPTHNCSLIAAISRCTSRAARGRNLHVEGAGQMQRLDLAHPGEGELVVGPFALGDDGHFVFAGAFERPVVIGGDILDHRERMVSGIDNAFEQGHAVSTLPFRCSLIRTRWPARAAASLPAAIPEESRSVSAGLRGSTDVICGICATGTRSPSTGKAPLVHSSSRPQLLTIENKPESDSLACRSGSAADSARQSLIPPRLAGRDSPSAAWGHADSRCGRRLLRPPPFVIFRLRPLISGRPMFSGRGESPHRR